MRLANKSFLTSISFNLSRLVYRTAFLLLFFTFTISSYGYTKELQVQVNYLAGPVVPTTVIITSRDGATNAVGQQSMEVTGNGTYYTSLSFSCTPGSPGIMSYEWHIYYIKDDGSLQGSSSEGGAKHCTSSPFIGVANIVSPWVGNSPQNAGNGKWCNTMVGEPVNVTNGNMYLSHTDYGLPASAGDPIEVSRSYNSMIQTSGLFGTGWSTKYDESLSGNSVLTFKAADGKVGFFYHTDYTNTNYYALTPGLQAAVQKQTDNSFTMSYKDGSQKNFYSNGRLHWIKDRKGNQTTLTYSGSTLTGITDSFGRTLTITISSSKISQISDSIGTVATYDYYTSTDRLKTVTFADGSKYKFEYTTVGSKTLLTTVKDALDNILESHTYDSSGRATTSVKDGGVEEYTFDYTNTNLASNPYTTVTDALDRVTKYYFARQSGINVVTKTEGACSCGGGGTETNLTEYDANLNVVKNTDALLNETENTYDSSGNLLTSEDVLGTQTYTYNSLGQVLTHTDRMSGVTTNTYDSLGNILTTTDPLGKTTTMTYTLLGQLASIEDARAKVTEFDYDTSGRLIKITDANAKESDFTHNARGLVTSVTNALNQTTEYEYDAKDRLNKIIHPDTNEVNFAYDLAGRRTSVADELGHETTYTYDDAYRLTGITDALNHSTILTYDLMSNLTSQTDALSNVTNFEYDDFNRLKKIVYPAPTPSATPLQETMTYDKNGNIKTKVDTGGRTTSYDYDTANRLTKITDALSNPTEFTYNARSQTTKVKDALNQEYTFTYDALGRVLTQTRNGTTMTFAYDNVGNRATRTDYNGNVSTYTYDDLNRLTATAYTGTSSEYATYTYDDLSRMLTAVNQNGTVTFTYDNRGRLKTEEDVFGHDLEYTYDAAGRKTGLELNTVAHTSYAYDNVNRLTTLTDEASNNFTFAYDNANRLTSKVMPNGITSTYSYDGMSRLKRLKHENTSTTLYHDQFTYNTANQISQIAGLAATKNYTYDNINRLSGMTDGTNTESYTYDAVGNRTASHMSSSYTIGSFNKTTATNSATYTYNPNGSTTGKTVGSINWTYGWDRENKMTSAGDGTNSITYAHDALGRRVKRTQGSDLQKYTHDGQDVVLDDINSSLTKYQNGPGIDNKQKLVTGGTSTYFLQDHLGSSVGIANSSGGVTNSTNYDSFGNAANSSFPTRYGYTGREIDATSGLNFYRARSYDSNIGKFVSEDPIGFQAGDVNLYAYVNNRPLQFNDPSGLTHTAVWQNVWNYPAIWPIIAASGNVGAAAAGGFAIGYGLGYAGDWTANHPRNPIVRGPLNPFGNPYPAYPSMPSFRLKEPSSAPIIFIAS